jgi:6-phosphogluconolactonase
MELIKTMHGPVNVCLDKNELGSAAAEAFVKAANEAISKRDRCTVGLSGGHTPPLLYEQITGAYKSKVDWSKVHFFMSDERCVPPDHKDSNWGMADRLLFSPLKIKEDNLHPLENQASDPKGSAEAYEQMIRQLFGVSKTEIPSFDIIQLGMGPDGHTASLFPGTAALKEEKRLVVDNFVQKLESYRITFTFPMLNHARHIIFMLEGAEKSHVFAEAVQTELTHFPVQRVQPVDGDVVWFTDTDSARDLLAKAAK